MRAPRAGPAWSPATLAPALTAYALGTAVTVAIGAPCPFRLLTGLDCPGCGGTRAAVNLAHGDLVGAFDHNAAALLSLAALIVVAAATRVGIRVPGAVTASRMRYLVGGVVAWTVLRNLPWFAWLGSGGA